MMDKKLFPFETIQATGQATADGDIAFDDDESCATPSAGASVITLQR
jgi:tRNA 2-thiocytidine biosynthesis protein TtcA